MKSLKYVMLVVGVALSMLSCRKDDFSSTAEPAPAPQEGEHKVSVSVSAVQTSEDDFEMDTRASLTEGLYTYYWTKGDKIGLFAADNSGNIKLSNLALTNNNSASDQLTTDFDGVLSDAQCAAMPAGEYYYAVYYPYQESANVVFDASTYTLSGLTLPSVQDVTEVGVDGFRSDYDFMLSAPVTAGTIASVEPTNLMFAGSNGLQHLFSAIRISVSTDEIGGQLIKSLTLTAPEGTALTGDFSVNIATREVEFTNPSNSVTINIPTGKGDLISGENCVWAIVNPVDLSSTKLTLLVTTESGYQYSYTFNGTECIAGNFHNLTFRIPAQIIPNITVGRIYTSYNDRNNNLDGTTIYYSDVSITADDDGYLPISTIAATGVMCNGTSIYTTSDKSLSFGYNHKLSQTQLGKYTAKAYVQLTDGTIVSTADTDAHVTGIPYTVAPPTSSDGWSFNRNYYEFTGNYWQLNTGGNALDITATKYFHIPADIPVSVTSTRIEIENTTWGFITLTISCSGNSVGSLTGDDSWDTNTFTFFSEKGTFNSSKQYMTFETTGNASGRHVRIYQLEVKYR